MGSFEKLHNANVCVRHFSRAKVPCMKDHLKSSVKEDPGYFVLHVGTDNLDSDRALDLIARSIFNVASSLKTCMMLPFQT